MMAADLSDSGDECQSNLSASELRKANKPLMEKRRRARINESLNMLKSLVLDALKRDTSRYSKLEKADILEMTVKHLRSIQRQQMSAAVASDSTVLEKYRNGYQECAGEVSRYLTSIDGLEPTVRNRLMNHLVESVQKVNATTQQVNFNSFMAQTTHYQQQVSPHQTHYNAMQPVQVQIPNSTQCTQLINLPGAPLDGTAVANPHVRFDNPSGNSTGNPQLLMVPAYTYGPESHSNGSSNFSSNSQNVHPYQTPSPNSSRSSSPSSTPPPGKDLNMNDVTGIYVDQYDILRRRNEDTERKQRAFHPYKQSTSPKSSQRDYSSQKLPLRPIVNQPIKSENMWRPW